MSSHPKKSVQPQPVTLSARVVQSLTFARQHGGALADNLTESGEDALLAQLRAGLRYAPAIAVSAQTFDAVSNLVGVAVEHMRPANLPRAEEVDQSPEDDAEDAHLQEKESLYLLGILVGLELAGGAR
jgi:hypothetical protein